MDTQHTTNPARSGIRGLLLYAGLIAAGLAGNYFKFPIFLNIDFLFGSTFAMLALQLYGFRRGVAAASVISSYTFILWNHPYAIVIMTAEAAVVGWLTQRRRIGMVLADTIFWLLLGMPLVYLFYHIIMHAPASSTNLTMTKQAVNGIANVLIARLIYTVYALWTRSSLVSYREIVYNLLAFFVLIPSLIMLAVSSRADFNESDRTTRILLQQDSQRVGKALEAWLANRKAAIVNLAEMSASRSPQQMQACLEQGKKSDDNFLRIGLADSSATSVAFYPPVDETGKSTIGVSFAERPYVPILRRTLKPMCSDVFMGKVGLIRPRVVMLAPVVASGHYNGYIFGVLDLEQVRSFLDRNKHESSSLYTLQDKNGRVIMSNRSDQAVLSPFTREPGAAVRLDGTISQWVPNLAPNTPASERWKNSYYFAETAVGDPSEWKLVLEQPVATFQKKLFDRYTDRLGLLFLILLGALALAELLSRNIVITLGRLRSLTDELPVRLAENGGSITWPQSGIADASHLISNFREMAESLTQKFSEVRQANASLEQRLKELRESERLTNDVLDSLPSNIAVLDSEGMIMSVNRRWEQFATAHCGMPAPPASVGRSYLDECRNGIDHHDQWAGAACEGIRSVLHGQTAHFSLEYPCDTPDEELWFNMSVSRLYGSRFGAVVSHTDITQRKRAEAALRASQAQYRLLIEDVSDVIWQLDREYRFIYISPADQRLRGFTPDEVIGHHIFEFLTEEGIATVSDIMQRRMKEEMQGLATGEVTFELQQRCRDGSLIWSELLTSPERDEQGRIIGYHGVSRDITERKRIEAELKARNADIEQFIYTVSHDLRTPLVTVKTFLGFLEGDLAADDRERVVQDLRFIHSAADKMKLLLDELLEMSRIDRVVSPPVHVTLREVLKEVLDTLAGAISEHNVRILLPSSEVTMFGDRPRLCQIWQNLIENAVKYSRAGVRPEIELGVTSRDGETAFFVRDNGIGIDPRFHEKIFDIFEKLDPHSPGAGLGLSMIKRIVEKNSGRVWVESQGSNAGSCFFFTLPDSMLQQ